MKNGLVLSLVMASLVVPTALRSEEALLKAPSKADVHAKIADLRAKHESAMKEKAGLKAMPDGLAMGDDHRLAAPPLGDAAKKKTWHMHKDMHRGTLFLERFTPPS